MAGDSHPFFLSCLDVTPGPLFHPFKNIFNRAGNIQDNRGWRLNIQRSFIECFRCICPLSLLLYIPGQVTADKDTSFRKKSL